MDFFFCVVFFLTPKLEKIPWIRCCEWTVFCFTDCSLVIFCCWEHQKKTCFVSKNSLIEGFKLFGLKLWIVGSQESWTKTPHMLRCLEDYLTCWLNVIVQRFWERMMSQNYLIYMIILMHVFFKRDPLFSAFHKPIMGPSRFTSYKFQNPK